jgi:serine phosphatase RsbU (regulator of sigma subunit)
MRMRGLRKQLGNAVWLGAMIATGLMVGGYLLAHERIAWPGWVPGLGKDYFYVNAKFKTAAGVLPGQGNAVTIAGVKVGEISGEKVQDGQAVLKLRLDAKYGHVHPDATLLLRPKTALKDMAAWAVVPELADWARVDLPDERGTLAQVAVAHRELDKVELLHEWRRDFPPVLEDTRGPAEVLRSGKSVIWSEVHPEDIVRYARAPRHAELMESIDTRSMLIVPMVVGEQVIGTMQLATTSESGRLLGATDLELAEELARRAAIAVEHARVHAARTHIATTLQRSLLPPRLPVIPGLTIAARFRAAGTATEVGGDFYDLFEGRERWVVLMGDVTGKGPGAAAITSLARYTMRTVAQYEDDLRAMVKRLNATLGTDPERRQICTAVCVGVRDVVDGVVALEIVCAGHPPPLLVASDGSVRAVGRPGTLLGAFAEGRWTATELALRPGDALVLYTDGVTDTRGPESRFGAERLEALLRAIGPADADAIASGIEAGLREFGEQRDDVAVLVLCGGGADAPSAAVIGHGTA